MATFTTNVAPDNTTAANFRAWALFIHNVFIAGLTNTADTGQIDLTTVAAPGAANTSMGYKIYRFNDALQATKPVFIKVEFGSGANVLHPGIWVTIATATDGAGNVAGTTLQTRTQIKSSGATGSLYDSRGSADTNRVVFAIFQGTTAAGTYPFYFSLERTKDGTGADTNIGLIMLWGNGNDTSTHRSQYILNTGVNPPVVSGMVVVLTWESPSTFGADVGVSHAIPLGMDAKQPGIAVMAVRSGDFLAGAAVPVPVYGVSRNYYRCGDFINTFRNGGLAAGATVDGPIRLCILYE